MPNYTGLKHIQDSTVRGRIIDGIEALRDGLASELPSRSATDSLLLATWNIREFDSPKYGWRGPEPYFYIVEILSHFDLIAVQEVRDGLYPLQRLKKNLGPWWDFLVTDVTLGTSGNAERMAFVYDRRKVDFTGLAAELVIPKDQGAEAEPQQFARSPYVASFRAGWAYLSLITVHIYYGTATPDDPRRVAEISRVANLIASNAEKLSGAPQYDAGKPPRAGNAIILGDFNIFQTQDKTMQALTDAGFVVPPDLTDVPGSNVDKNKHYDQIAYYKELVGMKPTGKAGVFDYYNYVYTDAQEDLYAQERNAGTPGKSFREWRTYQMSDHLPMWLELSIDDGQAYLEHQREPADPEQEG
ncbi:endonuclease/exonuclease/phosphatase family protein [Mycobacterium parascrofulaceum ATCC BAA-614]|uniref:Endonuclease/exonuclease/phosphatase family protein n=1 Tax=Mycobacterium parascrofulaceum ATCC BAA-614 TaxID=525368 RepID=D5P691_9MYCO|nr:endonuclease/exonuclease/phosphatase family protein [Mycobacterium parascrofulaceum]EFG78393.1 endonuclease/exonuclease/phosphatase family protein [Mycobacterium parascrofulaceum ATCC BAA-614]